METVRATYDRVAERSTKQLNLRFRGELFKAFYLKHLIMSGVFEGKNLRFAEIGCGYGDKTKYIKEILPHKGEIIGVDVSTKMLEIAQEKNPDIAFRKDDALELSTLNNRSFDSLFYFQVLHHLSLEEINQAFSIAKQKLKPQGKMVIIDSLQRDKWLQNLVFRFVEREYAAASIQEEAYMNPNKEELLIRAEDNGFKLIHETGNKFPYIISELLVFEKQ